MVTFVVDGGGEPPSTPPPAAATFGRDSRVRDEARELLSQGSMTSRSFVWWAAAAVGMIGCRSGAIDDRANENVNEARVSAEREAIYPTCPDRAAVGGNCGLILRRASSEDFRTKFRDLKCVGKDAPTCEQLYQKMIDAWLAQRYRLADWGAVALSCDSDPGSCDDPVRYELRLVDSHNHRVRDDAARAENEIEARREREQSAHMNRQVAVASAVIGEVAYATHDGPKCRSYPSVFAGVTNTICTP